MFRDWVEAQVNIKNKEEASMREVVESELRSAGNFWEIFQLLQGIGVW